MLSLLRILDNPLQDVPVLGVLFSPIYGFTPDEAAALRETQRHMPLYRCLTQAAKQGNQKCAVFLSQLSFLRRLSATLPAEALLRRIYEETGYPALIQAMDGAQQRAANLQLLLSYAAKYEAAGHQGLTGFIRFIDRLEEQQAQLSAASAVSESADVVRVMSIHKSKGLEFPICILANCAGAFNPSGRNQRLLLHAKLGAGLMRRDEGTLRLFSTLPHTAVRLASERSELSEELRVLYVALTRAREKLLLVMTIKNPAQKLSSLAASLGEQAAVSPFAVRSAKAMRIGCSPQPCATRTPQPCALSSQSGKFPFWRLISHCAHPFAPPRRQSKKPQRSPHRSCRPTWLWRKKSAAG